MEEKKLPEFLLKLIDGCSSYAQLAAKYWIACSLLSIVTLSVHSSEGSVKLPLDLPELNKTDFFPFMFLIISVLVLVFGSATTQAIRARWLINRFIYKPECQLVFPADIHLPDIIDAILYPAINRVAPLAQILQLKNRFLPEANQISSRWKRTLFKWYYGFLKAFAALILYGLPTFALGYCLFMIFQSGIRLSWITKTLLCIAGPLTAITLITLIILDVIYTKDAIKRIGMKKIRHSKG
jgi:hypothetical protein